MYIRYSRLSDEDDIRFLMNKCFGPREAHGVYSNLNGRYLLAFEGGKLAAMSGLNANTTYGDGVEIDWTCTDPSFRGCGVMRVLLERLISTTDEDVYCSCWRIGTNAKVNMSKHMETFNFVKIMDSVKHYANGIVCPQCPYEHHNCECFEDLYLRRGTPNSEDR